jgi:hypothetical protein
MKNLFLLLFLLFPFVALSQKPLMQWDFENLNNRKSIEVSTNIADTIEGNFEPAAGVVGKGLRLDGFTTRVIRQAANLKKPGSEFTIEGWVSLGEYPWNWCPFITTESDEVKGYRLMIGPLGQLSLQTAIGEQWISCTSANEILPLRKWMHIAGVYQEGKEMAIYVNGQLAASLPVKGKMGYPAKTKCIIGMVSAPGKPSDIHRTWGTLAEYYGLEGILDEIKIYDQAMTSAQIKDQFLKYQVNAPDIAIRKLPKIEKNPGRFGAFYTKLKYYPGWDNLWPVDQDPDIVVCFDKSPVKVIFWRGIRYGASWISENENWMSDQSVEAWEDQGKDAEGCFEHMQDRHCRFSHVRIIENNDARVVVHWRYAPVSAYNNTWRVNEKTGWECWIDEYYYIYPDATAIRKVSWNKGTLGYPRQFQESLPLLHPGQMKGDLLNIDYVHVADYENHIRPVSFVEKPKEQATDWAQKFTIQQYNFKSENKPFICFEPGNEMSIRWNALSSYDQHVGCNHFPVGQARCDGRTSKMSDRPSHCDSFPISDPVIHEDENREFWNGLYGINGMSMPDLVNFGRSWAYAPALTLTGKGLNSKGYDRSQRCYQIENTGQKAVKADFTIQGSKGSPIINPAIFVKNWNANGAKILVNGKENKSCRVGINHQLYGDDLVLYLPLKENTPVNISIVPL